MNNSIFDINYTLDVSGANIIRLSNNKNSVLMANRCAASCDMIGQKYSFFEGVDATSGDLIIPDHIKRSYGHFLPLLKQTNDMLTLGEIGCFLSHFFLWVKCATIEEPIIILEHDAVMVKPYTKHSFINTMAYLGCKEQAADEFTYNSTLPPHAKISKNYFFVLRLHAYAIDPVFAKNLIADVITNGLHAPADMMININKYSIVQPGLFAFDSPIGTTIQGRDNTRTPDQDQSDYVLINS